MQVSYIRMRKRAKKIGGGGVREKIPFTVYLIYSIYTFNMIENCS